MHSQSLKTGDQGGASCRADVILEPLPGPSNVVPVWVCVDDAQGFCLQKISVMEPDKELHWSLQVDPITSYMDQKNLIVIWVQRPSEDGRILLVAWFPPFCLVLICSTPSCACSPTASCVGSQVCRRGSAFRKPAERIPIGLQIAESRSYSYILVPKVGIYYFHT